MSRVVFPPKLVGETKSFTFDFTSMLGSVETISTQVVTATVYSGTDPTPSALISGVASASGAIVTQNITGGVAGNIYELKCTITTSASQTLLLVAFLVVEEDVT